MNIEDAKVVLNSHGILNKYDIKSMAFFGSFARGESYRDIDILIESDMHYQQFDELKAELQQIFNTKVDLVLKRYANPIVLYRAQKD